MYYSDPDIRFVTYSFTGHEHLDDFDLINMNGRMYDPLLAMFLSPDNFVQSPGNTQNLNRYAYCFNNPLVYVDSDGEIAFITIVGIYAVVQGGINIASNWSYIKAAKAQGKNAFVEGLKYFGDGAVNGVATAYGVPILGSGLQGGLIV